MSKDAERLYFPYIDGLRALSIIAVVLYHLEPGLLPGGFSGVDIFFVVSGFIVCGSLHGYKASSFLALVALFYSRRFRRIVPALLFMLVTTSLAVVVFIPEAFLSNNIRRTAIAAFFGFSNFRLAGGPDYFSPLAEFNPFTHTWSLGVEEQFYLIFPVLIFLLTQRRPDRKRVGRSACSRFAFSRSRTASSSRRRRSASASIRASAGSGRSASGVLLYAVAGPLRPVRSAGRCRCRKSAIATFLGSALIAAGFVAGQFAELSGARRALPVAGALLIIAGLQGRVPLSPIGRVLEQPTARWRSA